MGARTQEAVTIRSKQTSIDLIRLLGVLAMGADDETGIVDPAPSRKTLARLMECEERTITNRIKKLLASGELDQLRVGSGPGNASAFRINLEIPETTLLKGESGKEKGEKGENLSQKETSHEAEMGEIRSLIFTLSSEIAALKGEILSLKGERVKAKGGKGETERGKGHSSKSADDPYLDPDLDPSTDPEEERETPPLPPQKQQLAEMVNALAEVTVMDGHANWGILSTTAVELLDTYSAEQVRLYYGLGQSANGHWNWYLHDWRGQKNEPPRPKEIRETIKKAVAGIIPQPKAASQVKAPTAADSYAEVFGP